MAIFKARTLRRREVRRHIEGDEHRRPYWLSRREAALAVLCMLVLTAVGSVVAWCGSQRMDYRKGQLVVEPVIARVDFESIDKQATTARRLAASGAQPAVYKPNLVYLDSIRSKLDSMIGLAGDSSIESFNQISKEQKQSLHLTASSFSMLRRYITDKGVPSPRWQELAGQFIADLSSLAVLAQDDVARERKSKAQGIIIQPPGAVEKETYNIISVNDESALDYNFHVVTNRFPRDMQSAIRALVSKNIQPTYLHDERGTQRRRDAAAEAVDTVKQKYEPNDVLVEAGVEEIRTFSDMDIKLIHEERSAYRDKVGKFNRMANMLSHVGLVLAMAIYLWVYFAAYYRRVVQKALRQLAIVSLLLLCQAAVLGLTQLGPESIYIGATLPTLIAAIVLAITYDQRFGLTVGAMHALLVTFSLDQSLGFTVVLLIGVATAVSQLRDVRHRSKLVLGGLWTGLAMGLGVALIGLLERPLHIAGVLPTIGRDSLLVLASGFVAGLFVQGMLPGIERLFKVTTSMTLKDLNDAAHPLLRRLAERAPGTYQHSLRIADMGESAADAIGVNGLLCRVGAMYHDVGKMNKPEYFVENQSGGPNKHNKLSPAMSLLIIVGHVKDGVEMGREYHLPSAIRQFIESHHGTTLVEYFYHAARKQQVDGDDKVGPSEFEFRYPGPKPAMKESAIIMLCDTIESAARALALTTEPTPARLEQLVHQMASKRLMDGQFDQCNLTFKELHKIEQSVTKTLCAIYHGRIAYPGQEQTMQHVDPVQDSPQAEPTAS